MSYYSNEDKKQIYKRWLESGRPWFDIDPKLEPTYAEKQIILEMLKRENTKLKKDKELEKRTAEIKRKYTGKIRDSIFELGNY
jgi:hypothetical protein